jgi:fimbrial chaperone protein
LASSSEQPSSRISEGGSSLVTRGVVTFVFFGICLRAAVVPHLAALVLLGLLAICGAVRAQGIMVSPVNIEMAPGQMAAVLTVSNQSDHEIAFQIRAFAWQQSRTGDDQLTATDELQASPPIATIAAGASQVARLVLRRPPQGREVTYRILLDELSPPAEAGRVHIALRLSIPVFVEPAGRVNPLVQWRITSQGGQAWLLAANDGTRHQTVRDLALRTTDGRALQVEVKAPPHLRTSLPAVRGVGGSWLAVSYLLPAASYG